MATTPQLKNTLAFLLAPGASVVLPHGLSDGKKALSPDIVFVPSPDLGVTASDDVAITLANTGGSPIAGSVLVEAWHTIEREFGAKTNENLPVKPYVVVSVEANDEPPQPPFELSTRTIYARATGSDLTGNGLSELTAYRTFKRAIQDVPSHPGSGASFIVDITGIGSESFPAGYCLPLIQFPAMSYDNDSAPPVPYFYSGAGLRIRALPKDAVLTAPVGPASATQITAADAAVISEDPDSGLITLTLGSAPRPSWTTANLVDKMVIRTVGSYRAACVIVEATTTTIKMTNIASNFNGGVGPLVLDPGEVLRIVEPSATFVTADVIQIDYISGGGFGITSRVNSLALQGIKMENATPGFPVSFGGLDSPNLSIELCDFIGFWAQGPGNTYWCYANASVFRATLLAVSCSFFSSTCHFRDMLQFYMVNGTPQSFTEFVFSNCDCYGTVNQNGLPIISSTSFLNGEINDTVAVYSGVPDAVLQLDGRLKLENVKISNAAGVGVRVSGSRSQADLKHVTGVVLGAQGIVAEEQAQISVDATTTLVGAAGAPGAVKSGDLAAAAYAALPQYDITAVGAGGATGTGSRILLK